jgi:hypothetical protein
MEVGVLREELEPVEHRLRVALGARQHAHDRLPHPPERLKQKTG